LTKSKFGLDMDSLLPTKHNQRGATLLVALVLLLLLTLLALTSARTATLQQRMSSNLQQQNLAFQAAESGIAAAVLNLNNHPADRPLNIGRQFGWLEQYMRIKR